MVSWLIRVVALTALTASAAQSLEILDEFRGPNYIRRYVKLSPELFQREWLRDEANRLRAESQNVELLQVRYCTSLRLCQDAQGFSHLGYQVLWDAATQELQTPFPLAEIDIWRGKTLIRMRTAAGAVSRDAIAGDPFELETPLGSAEIIWLQYWHLFNDEPALLRRRGEYLTVVVHSPDPTVELGRWLVSMLREHFVESSLSLYVTSNAWLPFEPQFPAYFPFDHALAGPFTQADTLRFTTVECNEIGHPMECEATGTLRKR